jgi:hypothetical protein
MISNRCEIRCKQTHFQVRKKCPLHLQEKHKVFGHLSLQHWVSLHAGLYYLFKQPYFLFPTCWVAAGNDLPLLEQLTFISCYVKAQAVSYRPLAAEARVRSQARSYGISVGQINSGTGFSPSSSARPHSSGFGYQDRSRVVDTRDD